MTTGFECDLYFLSSTSKLSFIEECWRIWFPEASRRDGISSKTRDYPDFQMMAICLEQVRYCYSHWKRMLNIWKYIDRFNRFFPLFFQSLTRFYLLFSNLHRFLQGVLPSWTCYWINKAPFIYSKSLSSIWKLALLPRLGKRI